MQEVQRKWKEEATETRGEESARGGGRGMQESGEGHGHGERGEGGEVKGA